MRILISEDQLENLKKSVNKDIDERSRSFAFTRKKRKFSKPERMSNPLRYKHVDRLDEAIKFVQVCRTPYANYSSRNV